MTYRFIEEPPSPPPEQPSLAQEGTRQVARTASRIGESIAGFPGDIFSLVNEFIAKPAVEFATGKPGVSYEETPLGKVLPTTATHRKRLESAFPKTLKPQNEIEKFSDQVVSDAASIFSGSGEAKLGKNILSGLLKSLGANTTGALVGDLTKNESASEATKLGTLLLLSTFDKPAAAKHVSQLYKPLEEKASKLAPVRADKLETDLNLLKQKMLKGTLAPSEDFVVKEIDAVLQKISNGKITPEEAWASKRSLNEKLTKFLYDIPKKTDQARARKLAQRISHSLDDVLLETKNQDPKFYKDLKSANKAFEAIAKSSKLTNWAENNLKHSPLTVGLVHFFGLPGVAQAGGALLAPYEATKILYRIHKSPELRKYYAQTLKAMAQENAPVFNKSIKKLDDKLQEEESKDTFKFVD